MFRSKILPVNITQYEHGRLAGHLALHWGNDSFDRPGIDFQSFVAGVTMHDWGYGLLDDVPIMEADESDWLQIMRRGIDIRWDDPDTDIIVKLHIRRLLSGQLTDMRENLVGQIDERVLRRLAESHYTMEQFLWIDRITCFCDTLALDFCFSNLTQRLLPVVPRWNTTTSSTISYEIRESGKIVVTPWPFSVTGMAYSVIGYRRRGYPDELVPELLPVSIIPR